MNTLLRLLHFVLDVSCLRFLYEQYIRTTVSTTGCAGVEVSGFLGAELSKLGILYIL